MAAPTPVSNSWASFLPPPTIGYSYQPESTLARTQMDSGRYRQRRRYTADIHLVSVTWQLTDAQLNYFNGWFRLNLLNGSLPFNIDLAFGDGLKANVAKFVGGYSPTYVDAFEWTVSATLEVESANLVSSAYELLLLEFVLADIDVDDFSALIAATEDAVNNNNFS